MDMEIRKVQSHYSADQIVVYLKHVKYPTIPTAASIEEGKFSRTLDSLSLLMRLHLLAFPFENTAMHYTPAHFIDISPQALFERLVLSGCGFGSYCFGLNELMLNVLRGLGFCAYTVGVRVNETPGCAFQFRGISHVALLVQLTPSEEVYFVDVGSGGMGIVRPIPLVEGAVVTGSAPPEMIRLVKSPNPQSALKPRNESNLEWMLEVRCGSRIPRWTQIAMFTESEIFEEDRLNQNFAINFNKASQVIWNNVVCVTYFEANREGDLGRLVLFGDKLYRRVGDKSKCIAVLETEAERIKALNGVMGLQLFPEDAMYIKGRAAGFDRRGLAYERALVPPSPSISPQYRRCTNCLDRQECVAVSV